MKKPIAITFALILLPLAGCGPSVTVEHVPPPDDVELVSVRVDVPRMRDPEIKIDGDADGDAMGPCDPPCDDGNPCTVNECQGGVCVYPDDTELPACDDGAAVCVAGSCCVAPESFSEGACVATCPDGETRGADGHCR